MNRPPEEFPVTVSIRTLIKITLFALAVLAIARLVPLLMLCFLSMLLAVSVEPLLLRLQRRIPRWAAISILVGGIVGVVSALVFFVSPPLYDQVGRIAEKAPNIGNSLTNHIPPGALHNFVAKLVALPMPKPESWAPRLLTVGELALGGLSSLVLVLVLMTYLLVDGRVAWNWILAFFGADKRHKLERTAEEIMPVISAYIVGQVITSVLCGLAVYLILTSLKVPAALVLAVLAAFFDVLPIIGFILTIVPAFFFALTVSPNTALAAFFLFGCYHAVENYLIVPTIYGNRLRVSGLVVLLAILAGLALGGIVGAILILPVIASYPIIEKIWLENIVGSRAIAKHESQARD